MRVTVDRFYNVGTGRRTSIADLAHPLLEVTGSDVGVWQGPGALTFVKNLVGSPVRAAEELGFEATVDPPDDLRSVVEWRNAHKEEVAAGRSRAVT